MKSEDEQMIQRIMDTDTMGYASVYDSGSGKREEYLVALTAENLEAVYRLMQVYLKKHGIEADSYVFQNKKGSAYQSMTFRKQMIKHCMELGIKDGEYLFRSHDYRHGVATRFYDSGVSIQGVRDYLGHAYEEMTRQYIDYMPDRIDKTSGEFFAKPGNSLMACLKGGGD